MALDPGTADFAGREIRRLRLYAQDGDGELLCGTFRGRRVARSTRYRPTVPPPDDHGTNLGECWQPRLAWFVQFLP